MSLRMAGLGEIPAETVRVVRLACPRGTLAMRLRDEFGAVFSGEGLASLFAERGRPAVAPGMLALVTVLQFAEGLSDRRAAEAVRTRLDWKYALGLELTHAGFDHSVLCDFRARLAASEQAGEVFEAVLTAARDRGLLRAAGRARTDSTRVLAAVREVNWWERLGETLRAALNAVATAAPAWLTGQVDPRWFDWYGHRVEDSRLPRKRAGRLAWLEQVGADGMRLLEAVDGQSAPPGLRELPAVAELRRLWSQQFARVDGAVRLRAKAERVPVRECSASHYDPQARFGARRGLRWTGYLVHVTETCDPQSPNLITHVVTTDASVQDGTMLKAIHTGLAGHGRLPALHLVDAGYIDARYVLAARRELGVELLGPVRPDTSRSAQKFGTDAFTIDWDRQSVRCPHGQTSVVWRNKLHDRRDGHRGRDPVIFVRFAARHCGPCPLRERCTTSRTGRTLMLRPSREEHELLQQARVLRQTEEWRRRYNPRAGIEGTISQGVRAFGLRRCRYRGCAKTSLQHLFTASAINLTRLDAWIGGVPRASTRTSRFEALRPAA
ncbi:IS1182 family transposase [Streptomyces rimosus]|uniref:IS1182 family transposase n=1 Tax=Streptomyces rimosus TaxID=1927 RepID=UPI0037A94F35